MFRFNRMKYSMLEFRMMRSWTAFWLLLPLSLFDEEFHWHAHLQRAYRKFPTENKQKK